MVGDAIQNEYDNNIVVIDQDNEFELVFVIAYQKMLNLHYLDKLLDEIQLRWAKQFHSKVHYKRTITSGSAICSKIICRQESSWKTSLGLVLSLQGP